MPFDLKSIDFKNINLKDSHTQRMLAIALACLVASVMYIYFVFIPQIGRVVSLAGRVGSMKADLTSAKSTIAEMDGLRKKLAAYKDKVELYEKKLPEEQEIPNLLENLSSMAKDSNITITSIMPVPPATKEETARRQSNIYQEIPILITAKSGYHELGYFLSKLENADRFMKVVDIGIRADKTFPKKHDIELMVSTYVLLPEK